MVNDPKWLPSERLWLEHVALRLVDGDLMLLRTLPRWGVTTACEQIARELGDGAILERGRAFSEDTQVDRRERLDGDLQDMFGGHGHAQLLFDDYGRAIRRSKGGALHSMLYRALVDEETARDIGALLVARVTDSLDLRFAGSPLLSRARTESLPRLGEPDADALGIALPALIRQAGESTWLARRFLYGGRRAGTIDAVEHLKIDGPAIAEGLPSAAVEVVVGAREFDEADVLSQEALLLIGSLEPEGYRLADLVEMAGLREVVRQRNPGWPNTLAGSVRRFADLLDGVTDAIWVDRYLLADPRRARRFIEEVHDRSKCRIRLLCSSDQDRQDHDAEIRRTFLGMSAVEVRFMSRADYRRLHDRHLVFPSRKRGHVMPTAGVVLARHDPGSAVSVPMPVLALDFDACWRRATPVYPGG